MTETNITNSQLYELAKEMWDSLEDHHVGQEEHALELKAEIEKVREAQRALAKTLREIQFALYRQQNPGKRRPAHPQHDGDIFGGCNE
jgi:hypothetical protein